MRLWAVEKESAIIAVMVVLHTAVTELDLTAVAAFVAAVGFLVD